MYNCKFSFYKPSYFCVINILNTNLSAIYFHGHFYNRRLISGRYNIRNATWVSAYFVFIFGGSWNFVFVCRRRRRCHYLRPLMKKGSKRLHSWVIYDNGYRRRSVTYENQCLYTGGPYCIFMHMQHIGKCISDRYICNWLNDKNSVCARSVVSIKTYLKKLLVAVY